MAINIKIINSSIQSIGNSLVVGGLIASLFKNEVSTAIVTIAITAGMLSIIYVSINTPEE